MKKADLIIFDMDGTLVDSGDDIAGSVNYTLSKIGLATKKKEEIISYVGRGVEELISRSIGDENRAHFDKAYDIFRKHFRQYGTANTRLYPNVREVLQYYNLKRKVIITNRKREFALGALKSLSIDRFFVKVIGADDMACMKPSGCPVKRILGEYSVPGSKALIVGDMGIDVQAGKDAKIMTCAVTYGLGRREDLMKEGPDFMIDDVIELKRLIN